MKSHETRILLNAYNNNPRYYFISHGRGNSRILLYL